MAELTVVILNYNGLDFLKQFLPDVIDHSSGFQVAVIDNASTDQSVQMLEKEFPQVQLIQLSQNHGYAGGYNEGLKSIDSELVVLLNSDVAVTENWLQPVVKLFEDNPNLGACQPKIRSFHEKDKFEYAGASGGYIDWLGYPFCRGRILNCTETDRGQYDDTRDIFWASGACFCVRKSVFERLGGFDETFFAHMEEIDLCWRMNNQHLRIMVCPESTVYHVGGGTLAVTNPRKTFLNFRNSLVMLFKNLSWWRLCYTLPLRWVLDWAAMLKFSAEGNGKHALAVLKAHFSFLGRILSIRRTREPRQAYGPVYRGMIVWDYYMMGKRYFSQLPVIKLPH